MNLFCKKLFFFIQFNIFERIHFVAKSNFKTCPLTMSDVNVQSTFELESTGGAGFGVGGIVGLANCLAHVNLEFKITVTFPSLSS